MKQSLWIALLCCLLGAACNEKEEPEIPVIKEYELLVVDQADIPVGQAEVSAFMSHRPDFLVVSKLTDPFGKVKLINLKPGNYIFKVKAGDTSLGEIQAVVTTDNTQNHSTLKASAYKVEVADFTVIVKNQRGAAISGRKTDLLTPESGIVFKSGETDENGKYTFPQVPLGEYTLKIYDEKNEAYLLSENIRVENDLSRNEVNVEIVKLLHASDIVITGLMVDPKGTDCPKAGAVSGDGFAHPGEYEYIQLLALKDIDFSETPYCIITGMNATSPTDKTYPAAVNGWIQSKIDGQKTTYQMNLTSGTVQKGQFFYVGGTSRMIASYYKTWGSYQVSPDKWFSFAFYTRPGDEGNGVARGSSGIFNNLSSGKNVADGVAVFKGTSITATSIPQDVVFYGTSIREEDRYPIANNDHYSRQNSKGEEQLYFGQGTNTWFAGQDYNDDGCFILMGGEVSPTEWLKPRVGKPIRLNVKNGPDSVSLSDIEAGEEVTKFVDK